MPGVRPESRKKVMDRGADDRMLPIAVLALALIFFLLKLSGVLDDLAASRGRQPKESGAQRAPRQERSSTEAEPDRLRVFRDFIDHLPPPDDGPPTSGA